MSCNHDIPIAGQLTNAKTALSREDIQFIKMEGVQSDEESFLIPGVDVLI